jgi:hypothetical protein
VPASIAISGQEHALQAAALLVPFVPLVFIELPFVEVLQRLSDALF